MKKKVLIELFGLAFILFIAGCKGPSTNRPLTVTDVDGNVYGTISIGNQLWMDANLKVTHYRDGTPIPKITDGWDWWHAGSGAYCDYDNAAGNGAVYGRLYNWHAINTGKLAPTGWHVPTEAEWVTLQNFLGNTNSDGGKLKETGLMHWAAPNTDATNSTGFTALPGGYRSSTGSFFSLTYNGYWWTASKGSDSVYATYRFLDFNLGAIYDQEDYIDDGLSVRCIKD